MSLQYSSAISLFRHSGNLILESATDFSTKRTRTTELLCLLVFEHPTSSYKERSSQELTLTFTVYNHFIAWTNNSHALVWKQDTVKRRNSINLPLLRQKLTSSLMVNQEKSEKTILIVGVFFGVLALCVITLIICCLYWRRQLEKERARGDPKFGYNSDLDRNMSTGATSQIETWKYSAISRRNSFVEENICWLLLPSERYHIC